MHSEIRNAALKLGFAEAVPVTGQPFDVWRKRLSESPFSKFFSIEHDPAKVSDWPVDEITIWVAVAPTPPTTEWPDGCGEMGSFYMRSQMREARRVAWENAVIDMGYDIICDATLPERAAAIRGGLGVHGLNGLLLTPDYGSFVDITVLLIHAKPPAGARGAESDLSQGCKGCKLCIKACPTGAISENGINAAVCLRNYMNRHEQLPEEHYASMGRRIIGCETCQRVCPCNAKLEKEKLPEDMISCMKLENLLTNPDVGRMSKYVQHHFSVEKREAIIRQAVLSAANTNRTDLLPLIEPLVDSDDEILGKMAKWAITRLSAST